MDIVDISTLDVVEEEISVEINLVQSWTDTRCRYEVNDGIAFWLRQEFKESQSLSVRPILTMLSDVSQVSLMSGFIA